VLSILYIFFLYLNHFLLAYKAACLRLGMQGFLTIRWRVRNRYCICLLLEVCRQLIQQRLRALFFSIHYLVFKSLYCSGFLVHEGRLQVNSQYAPLCLITLAQDLDNNTIPDRISHQGPLPIQVLSYMRNGSFIPLVDRLRERNEQKGSSPWRRTRLLSCPPPRYTGRR
jgi:hypothetical protein